MGVTTTSDAYYDPYDVDIDADPYPVFARLRDEAPLYYNEHYDFYALSRFEDVERRSNDWRRLISAKGDILELIKANLEMPPGIAHLRGSAVPHHSSRPRRASSRRSGWRRWSRRSASSAPSASIRSSAATGSTSSPISAPSCPCR